MRPCQFASVGLLCFVTTACNNYGTYKPSQSELRAILDYVMQRPAGAYYLEIKVPGTVTYKAPDNSGKCSTDPGNVHYATHNYMLDAADEYIDVVLNDGNGVGGTFADSKSYTLEKESEVGGNQNESWQLVMQQSPNPASLLHVARWRLKLNAQPTQNEMGNGADVAPPWIQLPWERSARSAYIRATYRLHISGGTVGDKLTATLTFNVHDAVTHC